MDKEATPPARRLSWPGFVLDLERRELLHADGRTAELRRQALEVLLRLGADAGRTVGKDELMRCVWADVVVTEDSLVQAVADIRRVLGDNDHRIVRTAPRRGYALMVVPELAGDVRSAGPVRLPATRSPLVGRGRDVAKVLQRLGVPGGPRLLTLTGAGGSGKTRLAVEVAALAASRFPGGVAFAALESVREAEVVWATVARALGLKRAEGQPLLDALAEHLGARPPLLLVLDNLEQLERDACNWLGKLLDRCATLSLLATSRSLLHLYGEHELQVPPLELPVLEPSVPALDVLARVPAVELFVQRAQAADTSFGLTTVNAAAVAHLCHALDGLPLAIELAAARIKLLPPKAMLARMQSAAALETTAVAPSDRPERQRNLRATLDWSHALLGPAEQRLFRRLGVFAGSWTLESAEAVCDCHRDLGMDLFDGMASLLDKSLVRRIDMGGEARLAMLNTVRSYAHERLQASGELAPTQQALAAWCLVVAEEAQSGEGPDGEATWLDACEAEQDNLHAAFDALLATDQGEWALRLGVALMRYWMARDRQAEGGIRLDAALALPSAGAPTPLRAMACAYAGGLGDRLGANVRAGIWHRESLDIWRRLGDRRGEAGQLNALAVWERREGDLQAARDVSTQALEICRGLGKPSRSRGRSRTWRASRPNAATRTWRTAGSRSRSCCSAGWAESQARRGA